MSVPRRTRTLPAAALGLGGVLALVLVLVLGAACGGGGRSPGAPESLVLVTVDTLRADHLSAWGYERATDAAPELAPGSLVPLELARGGVRFARAFAPRGMTAPSVATLLTGRSPLESGVLSNGDVLPEAAHTLAESFRAAGHETAAFTANRLLTVESGLAQGFDHFDSAPAFAGDQDAAAVQGARAWLAQRTSDRPLFLWLHLMGPHMPYEPAPLGASEYAGRFADPSYAGEADGSRAFLDAAYAAHASGGGLAPDDVERVRALYDAEIARTSRLLGELLSATADADTAIVFVADHGEELHQRHGYWGHSKSVYDSVLHVPLVLHHPRSLPAGRVVDAVVELEDVPPTLLEWFGLPLPSGVRGRSFLDLARAADGGAPHDDVAFGLWRDRIVTARTARWRYVFNPERVEPGDPPQGAYPVPDALYDTASDPLELSDVAAEHPDVVAGLRARIAAWLASRETPPGSAGPTPEGLRDALEHLGYMDSE